MNNNRDKLVDNIDIVDEIGSSIDLEPKGRNYVGLCPFHADNNPSFTVSSEKKIYKCFVCGEGGDVVKFYRMFHHISNQAAIEALADKYQIKIQQEKRTFNIAPDNMVLSDINKFYVTALHSTDSGSKALKYLHERGFNNETINHFHLGLGYEQSDKLYKYLEKKIEKEQKYSVQNIHSINHFTNTRDLFAGRVTIPILKNGLVVGFGGRAIDSNPIKYLNSKDSKVFQKREVLFHFDEALRLSPDNSIVVVEGFFDVIKAFQFNIKNAVGLMGTSFTTNHIKQLKQKNIDTVFLGLDSDKAGQDATLKIGKLLLKNGLKVKVISYPNAKDLDEYLNENVLEDFIKLKKNSINFKVFQTESVLSSVSLLSLDEKDQAINTLLMNLHLENDLVIEQVLSKIEVAFEVSRAYLQTKLEENQKLAAEVPAPVEYQYNIPELDHNYGNEELEYMASQPIQPLTNQSNIDFMSASQLVIYRAMSSKATYLELKKYRMQMNKDLGIYNNLFAELDNFYNKYSKFDYVTFTNDNPQYALLINELYEKEITNNNMSNQHLVQQVKNKATWGIFGR
ncbi:DNA primase [Mollicutes bacterium LVI A0039]|nr:DNA primase [Mollicutes bacterium LVI A0039]